MFGRGVAMFARSGTWIALLLRTAAAMKSRIVASLRLSGEKESFDPKDRFASHGAA